MPPKVRAGPGGEGEYRYFDFTPGECEATINGFDVALMACVRELAVNALRHGFGPRPKIILERVDSTICCRITNGVMAKDLPELKRKLRKRPFGWAAAQSIAHEAGGQLRDEWEDGTANFTAILTIPVHFTREHSNGSDDCGSR